MLPTGDYLLEYFWYSTSRIYIFLDGRFFSSIDSIFRMQIPQPYMYGPIENATDDLEDFPNNIVVRGRLFKRNIEV